MGTERYQFFFFRENGVRQVQKNDPWTKPELANFKRTELGPITILKFVVSIPFLLNRSPIRSLQILAQPSSCPALLEISVQIEIFCSGEQFRRFWMEIEMSLSDWNFIRYDLFRILYIFNYIIYI